MNWKEDIKKFNLPHAKIMYMIYYFHKKNDLTDSERLKLKEYVILENNIIFSLFEEFETLVENKEEFLLSEFKAIYNEEKKYFSKKTSSNICTLPIKNEIITKTNPNDIKSYLNNAKDSKDPYKLLPKNINNNNHQLINLITSSPSNIKQSNENSPIGKQLVKMKKMQQIKMLKKVDGGGALISDDIQKCKVGLSPKIIFNDKKKKKKKNYEKTIIGQAITNIEREKKNY